MKIVYIITGMFNSAGMERVVANKANYFSAHGHDVSIITTDQNNRPYFYDTNPSVKCIDLGINFYEYAHKSIIIKPFLFIRKKSIFKQRLQKYLFSERPDIVVSLSLKSTDFLYQIKDGSVKIIEHHFSKYYIAQFSDTFQRNPFSRLIYSIRGRIESKNLKKYKHFVVLTHEDAKLWGKEFKNLVVIPNSLSFIPKSTSTCTKKVVVAIGRLDYQKGFDRLIRIWEEAYTSEWELYIYGNGPEKKHLEKLISTSKVRNSIKIFPATDRVPQILLDSSIYAMTSRFEGFPMILLEAMACGLPAVAMNCKCGPQEIINQKVDGFLVEEDDLNTFAMKLQLLMQDENLRKKMGTLASQNILRFREECIMQEWATLFTNAIKTNN